MERISYIDEHAITVDADRAATWSALLRVLCGDSQDPPDEARAPERFALKGHHPFAVYRWVFELEDQGPRRTRVRALTWANFPGVHGKAYRALVIGSGGHRIVVRATLRRIARRAQTGADYADVFEVPLAPGDVRTAEQTFRDGVGTRPGGSGRLVTWIHRHVLRFRLGPYTSPEHVIGWRIVRSDRDEIVLAADGPLMRGELTLHREDGRRATLTTRVHYRARTAARAVWAVVGPLHRVAAPRLMEFTARAGRSTRPQPAS